MIEQLNQIIEAALMVAGKPLSVNELLKLFEPEQVTTAEIREALKTIQAQFENHGIELKEVASGFQFQAKTELSPWLAKLWEERPARYSRALLETLALIAYRQPITRAEVEEVRGVSVSSNIIKTLLERDWIKVLGHRDVPGKPAILGTTKTFLDHFNLKSLDELPTLSEIIDLESQEAKLQVQLELGPDEQSQTQNEETAIESEASTETILSESETTSENNHEVSGNTQQSTLSDE